MAWLKKKTAAAKTPSPVQPDWPPESALYIDGPSGGDVYTGLLPVCGWAYVVGDATPEGVVEMAVDGDDWMVLADRLPVGGVDPASGWSGRCGFQAAVNTFCLENGPHTLDFRLTSLSTKSVVLTHQVPFRVDNVGGLADTVRATLRRHPGTKRAHVDAIDSRDFPISECQTVAWFERPDAEQQVPALVARHGLPREYEGHFLHFLREGYIVLEEFVPPAWCQEVNADLERALQSGVLRYSCKGSRVEHLFLHSKAVRDLWAHPQILQVLSALFDDQALPCQTLNFIHGSQQGVHQDTIHLTPFPPGYMAGVWVALEDIHPDSGPLVVYPRSHRLERLYTATTGMRKVRDGDWSEFPSKFIARLERMLAEAGLEPFYYTPRIGSVLIWHENLAHGGSMRRNSELTRKSMVSHYFARGSIAYYDSTGLPAHTAAA